MWNATAYFQNLTNKSKLTKDKYTFCKVTGIDFMEEVLAKLTTKNAFIAVDDTDEGYTMQGPGGGFFSRRSIVVFILKKYKIQDQTDRDAKLSETRLIHKQFLSKIVLDSISVPDLNFLDKSRIPFHEVPGYYVAGTCGVYFTLTIEEPIDLVYNASEWEQ